MSELTERAKGVADETIGKAKRAIGDTVGNADLKAEGDRQEAKGDAEKDAARDEAAAKA